jgi:osmotically-inducible protein OsmY
MALRKRLTRPLFWTSAGAAIAYLCDPQNGRGRRVRLNDQLRARLGDVRDEVERKARYVQSTAEGTVEALRHGGGTPADDRALMDRIKSEVLGGSRFEGHQVVVEAVDGMVTIRGEVRDREQAEELVGAVRGVPGVRAVENLTHLPGEAPPNKEPSLEASTG